MTDFEHIMFFIKKKNVYYRLYTNSATYHLYFSKLTEHGTCLMEFNPVSGKLISVTNT